MEDSKKENKNRFGLSDIQKAYYLGKNKNFIFGGTSAQITYAFLTELDPKKFELALNQVIKHQPMMRAIILNSETQEILEQVPYYKIKIQQYTNLNVKEEKKIFERSYKEACEKTFISNKWPLFAFEYLVLNEQKYLLVSFDLLIADGSSLMILAKEITQLYSSNGQFKLPVLNKTYIDYIQEHLFGNKQKKKYERDKKYWISKIPFIPDAPELPKQMKNKNIKQWHMRREILCIKSTTWGKIKENIKGQNISKTALVLTAYAKVLRYWSSNKEFTINVTVTERSKYKMENIIGDFTQTLLLPVYKKCCESEKFIDDVKGIMKGFMNSYLHSEFHGVEVIRELSAYRGTPIIMPVVFTSMLFKDDSLYSSINKLGKIVKSISRTPQVILDCQVEENNGMLQITFDYLDHEIKPDIIKKMSNQMKKILIQSSESLENYIEVPIDEKEIIKWQNFNNTKENYKDKNLLDLFYESVDSHPNKKAITFIDKHLTYKELDMLSNKVAKTLDNEDIGYGDFIGVETQRDISTIVNILGILKTGAAYIPINKMFPEKRKLFIIEKCNIKKTLKPFELSTEILNKNYSFPKKNIPIDITAYVIFTSGSTGDPKGVSVTHAAAMNTILSINKINQINLNDKTIGISSFAFDLSVYDIFGTLNAGAELIIANEMNNPEKLIEILKKQNITIWNSVPSVFAMLLPLINTESKIQSVRSIMMSGDWIPLSLPEQLNSVFPNAKLYSLGGATEASIWSIYYPIDKVKDNWRSVPYGYPLPNQRIYVLDKNEELCPTSVKGEICIGGIGVAEGYINDKDRTNKSFVYNSKLGRIYHTGDYGIMEPEGYISILGRMDDQIKIRGYRIEKGDIESCAEKYPKVNKAVVKVNKSKTSIVLFVEASDIDKIDFQNKLKEQLPEYMLPAEIIFMKTFPITSNGKIDKTQLKAPEKKVDTQKKPKTEMEQYLYELWCKILERNVISTDENFISAGGDSLKAAQLISTLQKEGHSITIADLYQHNTIETAAILLTKKNKELSKYDDHGII
ncbi:hypothetical protein C3495_13610 (plasmid) [Clostridiaceae bacterium 14S0207]|nr:hypothetical protein C3495_13610 [Clostridiaceae bacterium 14S0207]